MASLYYNRRTSQQQSCCTRHHPPLPLIVTFSSCSCLAATTQLFKTLLQRPQVCVFWASQTVGGRQQTNKQTNKQTNALSTFSKGFYIIGQKTMWMLLLNSRHGRPVKKDAESKSPDNAAVLKFMYYLGPILSLYRHSFSVPSHGFVTAPIQALWMISYRTAPMSVKRINSTQERLLVH